AACDTTPVAMSMSMFDEETDTSGEENMRLVKLVFPKLDVLSKGEEKQFLAKLSELPEGVAVVFFLYNDEEEKISKGIYKSICDASLTVNFRHEPVGSPLLTSWALRHFTKAGVNVERAVLAYFLNYVGNDMLTLKNEIDNCALYLVAEKRDELNEKDIEKVCKKSVSAQIFDISSNALKGKYKEAMAAFTFFKNAKEDEIILLATVSKAVYDLCAVDKLYKKGETLPEIQKKTGLRDFVVRNYVSLVNSRDKEMQKGKSYALYASETCLKYDMMLKSSRTDGYELLEELIFKLAVPCPENGKKREKI
ncbi:MAG: hypothetical protein J5844_01580, partial [Clostridia bacterium]|nr:hypothetical protein [Clostridia bacterium]